MRGARSPLWAMLLLGVLIALPMQQLAQVEQPDVSIAAWMLGSLLVYSSIRLAWVAYAGRAHPVALTFWVFVYIWCAFAPLLQTVSVRFARPYVHDADAEFTACLILWIGVACYEIGGWLQGVIWRREQPARPLQFSFTSVLYLAVFSVISTAILAVVLGPDTLLGSRGDVNASLWAGREKSEGLLLQSLLRGPPFISMMSLLYVVLYQWRELTRNDRRWVIGLLFVVVPVNAVANFPSALQRFWLGTIILTYLFSLVRWRPSRPSWYAGALTVGLIFIFPVFDAFRDAGTTQEKFSDTIVRAWNSPRNSIYRGDYDAYQMLIDSTIYVDEQGVMYGKNLYDSALFWFPRKWYPTKHVGTGRLVAIYLHYPYTNLAAPLWMESYVAFGWSGVVIILLLYGAMSNFMDRRFALYAERRGLRGSATWLVALFAGYQIYLLRGDLLSGFAYLSCPMLVILAITRWESRRQKSPLGPERVNPRIRSA
jgi:hypothetical protein